MPVDPPPITRVGSSRHTKKVSCETLILSNVDCKLPCNAQSIYYDGRMDADHGNSGEEQRAQNDSKLANLSYGLGNLGQNPSHCTGSRPHEKPLPALGRHRRALAQLLRKASLCKCKMSDASSLGRKRKPIRKFPSSVHGSGSLLPHSGPLMLPIGSHSGPLNNMSCKAPVLLKASSIIPSNAVTDKMSALVFKDPSSPEVTCLGRVRIKQPGHKRSCKRTAVVLDDDKGNERQLACLAMSLMWRGNKVDNIRACHSPMTQRERGGRLGFSVTKCSTDGLEGKTRCISKKESKRGIQVKITECEEMNASHPCEQEWQIAHIISPEGASYSEAEVWMNLSQFASVKVQQHSRSSCVPDRSQRFENGAGEEGVRQVPPQNALLRMRNSRAKDVQRLEHNEDNTHMSQEAPANALLKMKSRKCRGSYMDGSRCPLSSELCSAQETSPSAVSSNYGRAKVVSMQLQAAYDKPPPSNGTKMKFSNMWDPSSRMRNIQTDVFCQLKKPAIHRQASLPNAQVSLWQRRAVRKPYAIDIGRPSQRESKHPNTT